MQSRQHDTSHSDVRRGPRATTIRHESVIEELVGKPRFSVFSYFLIEAILAGNPPTELDDVYSHCHKGMKLYIKQERPAEKLRPKSWLTRTTESS